MSKTLTSPSPRFRLALELLFKAIVKNSGGSVDLVNVKDDAEQMQMAFSATLYEEKYTFSFSLVWNGSQYEVHRLASIEAVEELGTPCCLTMHSVPLYELGDEGIWVIKSPKGLLALFRAHNEWSKLFGFQPIFNI